MSRNRKVPEYQTLIRCSWSERRQQRRGKGDAFRNQGGKPPGAPGG
ncbi:hypothetical protein ACPA9J_27270 [Pseudomonas aeruginosa]